MSHLHRLFLLKIHYFLWGGLAKCLRKFSVFQRRIGQNMTNVYRGKGVEKFEFLLYVNSVSPLTGWIYGWNERTRYRLASVTSSDHISYCHFLRPKMPAMTLPEWIPIRMSTSIPVASRTSLLSGCQSVYTVDDRSTAH